MGTRTEFLGKLLGWYCVVVAIYLALHKQATVEVVESILRNPGLAFATGLVALVCGLALVIGHNVWTGGALPIVVTLAGWTSLLKGLIFLFVPTEMLSAYYFGAMHYQQWFYGYTAFVFLLGIYLIAGSTPGAVAGSGHSRSEFIFGHKGNKTKASIPRVA